MPVKVEYETKALVVGGRDGTASICGSDLTIKLSTPKELGGPGHAGSNPEQLFAIGYGACFLSTIEEIAKARSIILSQNAQIQATIGVGPRSEGGYGLTARLAVLLPNVSKEQTEDLIRRAHKACPYSNATRNNIEVEFSVLDSA